MQYWASHVTSVYFHNLALYIILSRDVPLVKFAFSHRLSSGLTVCGTFSKPRRNLIQEDIHVDKN